ncbi:hypothetical protein GDO78_019721 [Eleutherodactylus coqui]|uniref:ZW10 interactor n=2 Tax=Eleutherodactylus coqui TaxID=57060 RepID=A0A8J6C6C4_ELECQ|nr:hypothetical protein GDO78_019721 [Eleutherodactylus coqui]
MERRRKQKMLRSQLQVLRFLLEFLQEADSASWEETSPETLNQEVEEVKMKWKSLKSEYQEKVMEVEELIPQLLEKLQLLQEKKTQLEEALHRHRAQTVMADEKAKETERHLQEVFQKQQLVVEKCQLQMEQLKEEIRSLEQAADRWIHAANRSSSLAGLLSHLQGVSLVSVGDKELVLDIHVSEKTEIAPLRVNLHWTSEGEFQVEIEACMPRPPPELQRGSTSHIAATILELQCWYQSHGRLLEELSELRERYTIDWLPTERRLVVLKGNKHHSLLIEPGYPASGGVRPLPAEPCSVSDNLKPPAENPSLRDWLEYLHQ